MADKVLPQRVSVTSVQGDVGVRRSPWEDDRVRTGPWFCLLTASAQSQTGLEDFCLILWGSRRV